MYRWKTIFFKYGFMVLIPVFVIIFLHMMKKDQRLAVYTENDKSEYTVKQETETEFLLGLETYKSDKLDLSIDIPEGWKKVIKSGYDTFVDPVTASSVQIAIDKYDPSINNMTSDTRGEELSKNGGALVSFTPLTEKSYSDIYQTQNLDGVIDFFEYVIWDRKHIVKIISTLNDANYSKYAPTIDKVTDSLVWNQEDPIPDGIKVFYDEANKFEFGYPSSWQWTVTDEGMFYAEDTQGQTGGNMTVSVQPGETMAGSITQYDYASLISNGRSGYIMASFDQRQDYIYSEGSYNTSDGIKTDVLQYLYTDGANNCIVTAEFPDASYESVYPLCKSGIGLFKSYAEKERETEAETEPDTSDESTAASSMPTQKKQGMSNAESETQEMSEDSSEIDSSSFADAILQIVKIPKAKAQEISDIWNALGLEPASYAKGISAKDGIYMIYVKTESGMEYYLQISAKDGTLLKLTSGSIDGSALYTAQN